MAAEDAGGRSTPEHSSEHLLVGRVIRPHGIRGMLLVEAFTDVMHSLRSDSEILLGSELVPVVVRSIRPHRARFLLSLEGCEDRDAAERWRGQDIQLRLDDADPLPDGVYYHWQILGLTAITEDGEVLGEVHQIIETGANDVYVLRDDAGNELLVPAITSVILRTDLQAGQIVVRLMPGLRSSDEA
jgi:16S rRNA processing protein RimM